MPYSRSVQQGHPLPRNQLPDAGLVFDTLLKREKVRCAAIVHLIDIKVFPVCEASGWALEYDVLFRSSGHPYVRVECETSALFH